MISAPAYQGKTVGVFGLARTGLAAVKALAASGVRVAAWDDSAERRAAISDHLVNLYTADFDELDALLLAPGVPLTHPKPHELVEKARASETPLISDLDVFEEARMDMPAFSTVAITGTNGKSTTTSLIGHMCAACGRETAVGGNIGTGVLALEPLSKEGIYVFELSSFQLDLTQNFKANVAVLLNVTPDHLDRHGNFDNYVTAKTRLFDMQDEDAAAVIVVDDEIGQNLAAKLSGRAVKVSTRQELSTGVYVVDGLLVDAIEGDAKPVGHLSAAYALHGEHNWQNAAAAYAVGRKLGFKSEEIFEALLSFKGLEHRQEIVGSFEGVLYVNDSKATNSDATCRALTSFENIHWIAGGRAKETSFKHMLACLDKVKSCHFIGEAAGLLAGDLKPEHLTIHEGLSEAVTAAKLAAIKGDTVLLSPACTAFDQFCDFEARGRAFKDLVVGKAGS